MKKFVTVILAVIMFTMLIPVNSFAAGEEYLNTTEEIVVADWKAVTKDYFAMTMDFTSLYSTDGAEYGNGCVGFFVGASDAVYAFFVAHDPNSDPSARFNRNGDWGGVWGQNQTNLYYDLEPTVNDGDTVEYTVICHRGDGVFEAEVFVNGKQIMCGSDTVGKYVDNEPLEFSSVGLACKLISASYSDIRYMESDTPITYAEISTGVKAVEETAPVEPVAEAVADEAPAADVPVAELVIAPQTFDAGVIATVGAVVSLLGAAVVSKKRG